MTTPTREMRAVVLVGGGLMALARFSGALSGTETLIFGAFLLAFVTLSHVLELRADVRDLRREKDGNQ